MSTQSYDLYILLNMKTFSRCGPKKESGNGKKSRIIKHHGTSVCVCARTRVHVHVHAHTHMCEIITVIINCIDYFII